MIHENERLAFERGAEAMRKACTAEFNCRAEVLRIQQRSMPRQGWYIAADHRLSAEIADQEHAAYMIQKLPTPTYEEPK